MKKMPNRRIRALLEELNRGIRLVKRKLQSIVICFNRCTEAMYKELLITSLGGDCKEILILSRFLKNK